MNSKNSIIKNKSLWELPSVAMIVATIGVGCDTTELIVKNSNKKPSLIELKDEQQGFISQGTYNKYRNLLEKERIVLVSNKDKINRRSGEGYKFDLNYDKLYERIELIFKEQVKEINQKIDLMCSFFSQRIKLIEKRIKAYKLILEKAKEQSKPKKTYDMLKEDFIDKPHNLAEIKDIEEKIKGMHLSIQKYKELSSKLNSFKKENDALLKGRWLFSEDEVRDIKRILNTYFFWRVMSNDKSFTLNTIIKEFIEEVKNGELWDIGFDVSDKFIQGITGRTYQEISKESLPNLFNIFKCYKRFNKFRGVII